MEQRIIFKINLICFKILSNLAPDYLVDLIHVYEPTRNLRSSSDKWRLTIKPYNLKTYGFRAFSVIAPILWNDLPIDIRSIDDVNKFKCKLKTSLFKRTILGFYFVFCDYVHTYVMIFRLLLFNQIFFLHCKALSTGKYRRYINTFIIIIVYYESSRTTLAPSSLFRVGKILIYVNTDYHKLHVAFLSSIVTPPFILL